MNFSAIGESIDGLDQAIWGVCHWKWVPKSATRILVL